MRFLRAFFFSIVLVALVAPLVPSSLGHTATAQPVPPPPPVPELRVRIAPVAPPHVRREVIAYDTRPSRRHVWVRGYWHHDGGDWRWNEGPWAEPPARRARWIAPQYRRVSGGWRYVPGHWSTEVVIQD